jgi:hypothetical protein
MKALVIGWFTLFSLALAVFGQGKTLYKNDFEKAAVGQVPPDFLVLDGAFAVKEEDGNKFLELPGAPVDNFSVQFGPPETGNVAILARIRSTVKGRRYSAFGVGLNGVAGYKLQLSPAKKMLELYKDQEIKATQPYDWKSGLWTQFRFQVRKIKDGEWKVEGKIWIEGTPEPKEWMITANDAEAPPSGKASVFGSPISGTPIQFDDLIVSAVP